MLAHPPSFQIINLMLVTLGIINSKTLQIYEKFS